MKKRNNKIASFIDSILNHKVLFFCIGIVISIIITLLICNYKIVIHKTNKYVELKDKITLVSQENGNNIYLIGTDGEYVKKLFIYYKSNENFDMTIDNDSDGTIEYNNGCFYGFDVNVINTNRYSKSLTITVPNSVVIDNVVIKNNITFNKSILFILLLLFCIIYSFALIYKFGLKKIHILFFILYVGVGTIMIYSYASINGFSWDDHIHFDNIINDIYLDEHKITESENITRYLSVNFVFIDTVEEKQMMNNFLNVHDNNYYIDHLSGSSIGYISLAYLPASILYNSFKALGISFSIRFMLTKLSMLIIYGLIIAYAIKRAPKYKLILFVISLMPTGIYIAVNFNYDTLIFASTILAMSMLINFFDCKKVSTKDLLIYILCILFGTINKAIYAPMLLLLLMIPNEKFKSKKQSKIFKLSVIGLTILALATFILPVLISPPDSGDARGGDDVNVARQIKYIVHNPVTATKMFVTEIGKGTLDRMIGPSSFLFFAYLGGIRTNNLYFFFLIALFLSIVYSCKEKNIFSLKFKIFNILVQIGIVMFIWLSMYLCFNNVGSPGIAGVQSRYFMPLIIPVLFTFINNKMNIDISERKIAFIIGLLYLIIYIHFLLSLCIIPYAL